MQGLVPSALLVPCASPTPQVVNILDMNQDAYYSEGAKLPLILPQFEAKIQLKVRRPGPRLSHIRRSQRLVPLLSKTHRFAGGLAVGAVGHWRPVQWHGRRVCETPPTPPSRHPHEAPRAPSAAHHPARPPPIATSLLLLRATRPPDPTRPLLPPL